MPMRSDNRIPMSDLHIGKVISSEWINVTREAHVELIKQRFVMSMRKLRVANLR